MKNQTEHFEIGSHVILNDGEGGGEECEIICHYKGLLVIRNINEIGSYNGYGEQVYDMVYCVSPRSVSSIKSEKDKEIEKIDDAIDEWQNGVEMIAEKSLAEYLYENGFRFVEES